MEKNSPLVLHDYDELSKCTSEEDRLKRLVSILKKNGRKFVCDTFEGSCLFGVKDDSNLYYDKVQECVGKLPEQEFRSYVLIAVQGEDGRITDAYIKHNTYAFPIRVLTRPYPDRDDMLFLPFFSRVKLNLGEDTFYRLPKRVQQDDNEFAAVLEKFADTCRTHQIVVDEELFHKNPTDTEYTLRKKYGSPTLMSLILATFANVDIEDDRDRMDTYKYEKGMKHIEDIQKVENITLQKNYVVTQDDGSDEPINIFFTPKAYLDQVFLRYPQLLGEEEVVGSEQRILRLVHNKLRRTVNPYVRMYFEPPANPRYIEDLQGACLSVSFLNYYLKARHKLLSSPEHWVSTFLEYYVSTNNTEGEDLEDEDFFVLD